MRFSSFAFAWALVLLGGFVGCSAKNISSYPAIIVEKSPACQQEITQEAARLIGASHLEIGSDVFEKSSSLYLSNDKIDAYNHTAHIRHESHMTLRLFKTDEACFIARMAGEKQLSNTKALHACSCKKEERE